jgi:hypothetical protein
LRLQERKQSFWTDRIQRVPILKEMFSGLDVEKVSRCSVWCATLHRVALP